MIGNLGQKKGVRLPVVRSYSSVQDHVLVTPVPVQFLRQNPIGLLVISFLSARSAP